MPVGDRYIDVPAQQLRLFLVDKGFVESTHRNEIIFVRRHNKDPRFAVIVYSSIRTGASSARRLGADAIRVCAIFTPEYVSNGPNAPSRGVAKLPRIYRTGTVQGVLQRILERSREAYAVCNRQIRGTRNA